MSINRGWMSHRRDQYGQITNDFRNGVIEFLDVAYANDDCVLDGKIKCPCFRCFNSKLFDREQVHFHLFKNGFMRGYKTWVLHGEPYETPFSDSVAEEEFIFEQPSQTTNEGRSSMRDLVMDLAGHDFEWTPSSHDQLPNSEAQKFFDLLNAADEPLYKGCEKLTKLSTMSKFLNIKSDFNMSEACYDRIMSIMKDILPEEEKWPRSFYETKKELSKLGLAYEKIDACINKCMLYYKENKHKEECVVCHHPRYKPVKPGARKKVPHSVLHYLPITPRLQRLYMSSHSCEHMTWHKKCFEDGIMTHPAHGEAWKHFDNTHTQFSSDPRSIRLGLCTDGFSPFNMSGAPYSCWPVILTVYNLPPGMCMQRQYMYLSMVIPGPKSPGKNLDVFLRPLIDELKMLWEAGIQTYDVCKKENFQMRAALLWTISDFPANAMVSGWSTHGLMACPYCIELTKSFSLRNGRKPSWFDCHRQFLPMDHPFRNQSRQFYNNRIEIDRPPPRLSGEQMHQRVEKLPNITFGTQSGKQKIDGFNRTHNWVKKSIFWELPYWHTNLIRHNLDVMHIEKNVFDNIFNTVMDVKDKSKDNANARADLELYCSRPNLHLVYDSNGKPRKPKALYTLTKEQKKEVCGWVKNLKLPDGYASYIARCVNEQECKFYGLKSHDCHVFMQRLLPIVFRNLLPKAIWEPITELSCFFRDICATKLRVSDMEQLESNIVETICRLEKIFPPAFFDSMEHLIVHLAYEANVGGPVQYRWMYPFERFLHHLKKKVKNRARVEASIVQAYLIEEMSTFCSLYFESTTQTRLTRAPRNDDGGQVDPKGRLSVFAHPGRPLGPPIDHKILEEVDLMAAHRYILLNCTELNPIIVKFDAAMMKDNPSINHIKLGSLRDTNFVGWFNKYAEDPSNAVDDRIVRLSYLPCRVAKRYKGYFVNGFKFHTKEYGNSKSTMNSGVWVWGTSNENDMTDYYGMLEEIIELEYFGNENKVVLFKCHWYDTTSNNGIRVHPRLKLVEINQKSKLNTSDKFILAQQAQQVYYTDFPKHPIRHSRSRVRGEWRAVCKIKARSRIDVPHLEEHDDNDQLIHEGPFQEMEDSISQPRTNMNFVEEDHDPLNPDFDLQEVDPKDLARPQAHLFDIAEEEEDDEEGAFENLFSNDEENLHENEDNEISDCDDEIDYDD